MNSRGFTLIEVLVAMALTGLVAVLAYGALSSSIVASQSTESEALRLRNVEQAIQMLQRDLTQAVLRPVYDSYGQREAAFAGGGADESILSLTRGGWPNARQQLRSDLQRVRYRRQDDQLMRDYWMHSDRSPEAVPVSVVVLDNLEDIQLRFLDGSAGNAGPDSQQWRDHWLARDAGDRLPAAVEVRFELAVWGEVRRLFVLPSNG